MIYKSNLNKQFSSFESSRARRIFIGMYRAYHFHLGANFWMEMQREN